MLKIALSLQQFIAVQKQLDPSILSHVQVNYPFENVTLSSGQNSDTELWIVNDFNPSITEVSFIIVDPMFDVSGEEVKWKVPTLTLSQAIEKIKNNVTEVLLRTDNTKVAHDVFDTALGVSDVQDVIEDF